MITYAEDSFTKIESKQDDCWSYGRRQDGYGRKIATSYLVRFNGAGRWRRVYCCCYSNSGTLYVTNGANWICFRCDENLRLNGVWPNN